MSSSVLARAENVAPWEDKARRVFLLRKDEVMAAEEEVDLEGMLLS